MHVGGPAPARPAAPVHRDSPLGRHGGMCQLQLRPDRLSHGVLADPSCYRFLLPTLPRLPETRFTSPLSRLREAVPNTEKQQRTPHISRGPGSAEAGLNHPSASLTGWQPPFRWQPPLRADWRNLSCTHSPHLATRTRIRTFLMSAAMGQACWRSRRAGRAMSSRSTTRTR